MLNTILNYVLLRKATPSLIENILKKEKFTYTKNDIVTLLKGNQKGTRYGNIILERSEDGQMVKRFLKVVLDGTWRTFTLFERQVKISEMLHRDPTYTAPTLNILHSHLSHPVAYAIFETRESGNDFGFMDDKKESYEQFTTKEIENLVEALFSFHHIGEHVDPTIWKYTRALDFSKEYYVKKIHNLFATRITHKKENGDMVFDTVENIIKTYTNIKDPLKQTLSVFTENWKESDRNKTYLVHGDMSLDNTYKHPNGKIELLDFEWVSHTKNPLIALMYDYGNVRARAWSSPSFQSALDSHMLNIGEKYTDETTLQRGMTLGKLYYSLTMCRFHLDFTNTVKKDRRGDEEYFRMFPASLHTLLTTISGV